MEYLIILKDENNEKNIKFNNIKKWFFKNLKINSYFFYPNEINLNIINKNNFFIISENITPLLCSKPLEILIEYNKSYSIKKNNNVIANISMNKSKNERYFKITDYPKIYETINKLPSKNFEYLSFFDKSLQNSKHWFYIDDINYFLKYLENEYFTWTNINNIKLKIANKYPNIIFYDGKNKLESKKIIEELNIKTPKTYKIYNNTNEITKEDLDNFPNCVIKPTNLDGGNLVFLQNENNKLDINNLKYKMKDFQHIKKNKELMPLIKNQFKPKIIMEEYIKDLNNNYTKPCEFKFYIFDGKILFFIAINRKDSDKKFDFFDENFKKIPCNKLSFSKLAGNYKWPKLPYFNNLKKDIIKIYKKFNNDLNHSIIGRFIRIDFFITQDEYYFGEFSLFPNGGAGNNLNEFGKKFFIKNWIPEVFNIFNNQYEDDDLSLDKLCEESDNESIFFKLINFLFS